MAGREAGPGERAEPAGARRLEADPQASELGSSLRIDSLSAGWESESSSAARLKLPCSATATK